LLGVFTDFVGIMQYFKENCFGDERELWHRVDRQLAKLRTLCSAYNLTGDRILLVVALDYSSSMEGTVGSLCGAFLA
jgi:hypothetical protein